VNDAAVRAQTYTPHQIVARVSGKPPDFDTGTRVEYSNTNYVLLGLIVEAATHKPLDREVTRRILEPLRLHDTRFPTTRTRGHSAPPTDGEWWSCSTTCFT
jgi:D-alanyl-D-alanine carboxypeptidase